MVMEGVASNEQEFELNAWWDEKQEVVPLDRGDVVAEGGVGEQIGGVVLDVLEFIEHFGG